MSGLIVRKGRKEDSAAFLRMLTALADFEHLKPPSVAGTRRIIEDIFRKKRVNLLVALRGERHLGYALYFYTYSSFLARPTLYIEDLFVLEEHRKTGVGIALFRRLAQEASIRGCGRMEWSVLDWNRKAISFYETHGATRLKEWYVFRLPRARFASVTRETK